MTESVFTGYEDSVIYVAELRGYGFDLYKRTKYPMVRIEIIVRFDGGSNMFQRNSIGIEGAMCYPC